MRIRNARLRTKIVALLLSLTALWMFAAWVTLREGVNLLWVSTMDRVAAPSDPLLVELQRERRLSVTYLADPRQQRRDALLAQRARTDSAKAVVVRAARTGAVRRAADDNADRRIDEMVGLLDGLGQERRSIDMRQMDRRRVIDEYAMVVESVFRLYDSIATLDDDDFATDTRIEIAVNRSWELLSQEDALVAGVLTTGRLGAADQLEIAKLVGARRLNTARALADLERADVQAYKELANNRRLSEVARLEDLLLRSSRPGQPIRMTAEQWRGATEPAVAEMRQSIQRAGDRLVARATPIAVWVVVRLLLAGVLGLFAVIASIVVSITTARALVRQLERLRTAAWELADQRLPAVVERLGRGEDVDVAAEAPELEFGDDEVGQVGQAFNAVQQTAIKVAVEQAELRRGIRDVLLSLARRTQTLVRRQLSLLDVMERRELDPTELEDLFRVDHLATRMRRNAENLIVLSGATPARGWRRSVPMVDVLRAAVAEVEDYTRVNVLPVGGVTLAGRAVGDVTHLLAELVENAVSFSPSYTVVQVGGHMAASGYAIEIEDRGLGMGEEALHKANEQIASSPEFNLSSTARLGLYVVSRLADRYGIRVSLKRSAYGGTTAIILIPREFVIAEGEIDPLFEEISEPAADGVSGPMRESRAEVLRAIGSGGLGDAGSPLPVRGGGHGTATALDARPGPADTTSGGTSAGWRDDGVGVSGGAYGSASDDVGGAGGSAGDPYDRQRPGTARRPEGGEHAGAATGDRQEHGEPGEPRKHETAGGKPMAETTYTPSGLPFRVPQASLAPPLRTDESRTAADQDGEGDVPRSPEEVRKVMGAYQAGTRRGRSDAVRSADDRPASDTPPGGPDDE
ncbi:sensor histidine kinase [Actinomadura alba]|uniref:histidine kinase n=1 Tax=Actinomadura alba TaxID=406431 RepID=A0ABR7LYI6_9ACTN|nr:nitrate- and nitrite sensing domain-containing protein [Actinomadura alba]MBC6469836.1 nitrate- and nitrite sensing domain-containing protein [Actinomadura alba]